MSRRQRLVATFFLFFFFSTFFSPLNPLLFTRNASKVESLQRSSSKCLCAMRMEVLEDDELLLITYPHRQFKNKLQSVMYRRRGKQTERKEIDDYLRVVFVPR